jgi:hypothetical protein
MLNIFTETLLPMVGGWLVLIIIIKGAEQIEKLIIKRKTKNKK